MTSLFISIGFVVLGATGAGAQASYNRDIPDSLARQAKVSETVAPRPLSDESPRGRSKASSSSAKMVN